MTAGPHPGSDERTGRLARQQIATGSKSEAEQFVLHADPESPARTLVLHTRGSDRLDADPALAAWEGRRVRVRGTEGWTTFVVDEIVALD